MSATRDVSRYTSPSAQAGITSKPVSAGIIAAAVQITGSASVTGQKALNGDRLTPCDQVAAPAPKRKGIVTEAERLQTLASARRSREKKAMREVEFDAKERPYEDMVEHLRQDILAKDQELH